MSFLLSTLTTQPNPRQEMVEGEGEGKSSFSKMLASQACLSWVPQNRYRNSRYKQINLSLIVDSCYLYPGAAGTGGFLGFTGQTAWHT